MNSQRVQYSIFRAQIASSAIDSIESVTIKSMPVTLEDMIA